MHNTVFTSTLQAGCTVEWDMQENDFNRENLGTILNIISGQRRIGNSKSAGFMYVLLPYQFIGQC